MDTGVKVLNKRLSNRIQQYIKRPTEAYLRNAKLTQYLEISQCNSSYNSLKEIDNMIISIDAEITIDKIQHSFTLTAKTVLESTLSTS